MNLDFHHYRILPDLKDIRHVLSEQFISPDTELNHKIYIIKDL